MGDYSRTTRECRWDDLHPRLRQAIVAHIEKFELPALHEDIVLCSETYNKKSKKRLMGGAQDPDQEHYVAAFFTPGWFVWARFGERSGDTVLSARLADIEARDYAYAHMIEDSGLHISGRWGGGTELSEIFLGLGTEAAASNFAASLKRAIEEAHS